MPCRCGRDEEDEDKEEEEFGVETASKLNGWCCQM